MIAQYRLSLTGLKRLSGPALDTISGSFFTRIGLLSIEYEFEKDGTFRMVEHGCMGDYLLVEGPWIIKRNDKIELSFGRTRKRFVVYQFQKLLFLVSPASVRQFKKDFFKVILQCFETKSRIVTTDKGDPHFIEYSLFGTYFTHFLK